MKTERYHTFIDKRKYTFEVAFYILWHARAYHEGRLVGIARANDPEAAALELVKQLETGNHLKNLLK